MVIGATSVGVKRPGREAKQSTPYDAEAENACTFTFTPPYVIMT